MPESADPASLSNAYLLPIMNRHPSSMNDHATAIGRRSLSVAVILLIAVPFGSDAPAQSATNFDTKIITPKASAPKKAKSVVAAAKEAGPVSATPSRYVGEGELDAYVESLSSVFSMRGRATDPFGQLQDPDAKPVIKTSVAKTSRRVAPAQATPFADIMRLIKVTTVMPGEKRFLIGTRSFKQGGRIPIVFRNKNVNAEIVSVNSQQIDFRNLDNGETASIKINLLPVGMTPGTGGITAPGMVPDRPNAPIELDSGMNPDEISPNR